jgi:aromatic ring-cleaving dioxygenase
MRQPVIFSGGIDLAMIELAISVYFRQQQFEIAAIFRQQITNARCRQPG